VHKPKTDTYERISSTSFPLENTPNYFMYETLCVSTKMTDLAK